MNNEEPHGLCHISEVLDWIFNNSTENIIEDNLDKGNSPYVKSLRKVCHIK